MTQQILPKEVHPLVEALVNHACEQMDDPPANEMDLARLILWNEATFRRELLRRAFIYNVGREKPFSIREHFSRPLEGVASRVLAAGVRDGTYTRAALIFPARRVSNLDWLEDIHADKNTEQNIAMATWWFDEDGIMQETTRNIGPNLQLSYADRHHPRVASWSVHFARGEGGLASYIWLRVNHLSLAPEVAPDPPSSSSSKRPHSPDGDAPDKRTRLE